MESLDKDNLRTLLHIFWVQIDREKGLNNERMSSYSYVRTYIQLLCRISISAR